MTSKIIQISASRSDHQLIVLALCEDGTVWYRLQIQEGSWVQLEN